VNRHGNDGGPRQDGVDVDTAHGRFDELRTGFTAAVSHELRTPLARILALLDSADLPGADVHALIAQARIEVEDAGALIDEILFLSELESGREVVALGHTTALPVLQDVIDGLDDSAARAGVELAAEGDGTVDVPLRPRMLRIVAVNLAENAIRYAGHGARFSFVVARSGDFVVVTAADDGVGVPSTAMPRLFERFYRSDAARTTRGTGLGLAIVKHIVVAAGGDIDADGGPGQGLRIRATFPG
jgi:two-component system, OmpR family, phosphate regulon sensor histidine kinase PhoR